MIMAHKPNDHHGKTEHEKAESKFSDIGKDNDHHRHTEKERIESKIKLPPAKPGVYLC
jgi:hypothetical protein